MTSQFEHELREQPDAVARLLDLGRATVETIADRVRGRVRFVVLAARGSSDNAARYGQYVLGIQNGLLAALATPSVYTHYHASVSLAEALVIGISQSGQSPDVVEVVQAGRRQGACTLAITNDPQSPLATAAELVLPLSAGTERAIAATKTYTTQVAALAMLSAALRGQPGAWEELRRVPEQMAQALDEHAHSAARAEAFREYARLAVLGRGYNLSTVMEITLKTKEMSGVMADGYSSADFVHGPKAILDRGLPILVVAPGRVFPELDGIVREARDTRAPIIAITDREELLAQADVALRLAAEIPEWLAPLVAIVPGQLWALGLSLARGMRPDAPPGLSKVTCTR